MANDGTMIYGQISPTDCMAVLPTSATNVFDICSNKSGNIKKWARWKPLIWPNQFTPRTDMWRGPDGRCGMTIKTYGGVGGINTPGTFLYDITHNLCEWVYNAPQGGTAQPCRIGDFAIWPAGNLGYINNAIRPFGGGDIEVWPSDNGTVDFPFEEGDVDDSGNPILPPDSSQIDPTTLDPNLSLLDFAFNGVWAGEFYYGIALSNGLVFTGDKKLKDGGGGQVAANNLYLTEGATYTAWPFLSSYSRPYGADEQVGTLIPLDNFSFKVKVIKKEDRSVAVWAYATVDKYGHVEAYLVIENNTDSAVTISNPKVQFMRGKVFGVGGDLFDSIVCTPKVIDVPAGSTGTSNIVTTSVQWPPPNDMPMYWARGYVTSSTPRIVYKDMPFDEADDGDGGGDYAPD